MTSFIDAVVFHTLKLIHRKVCSEKVIDFCPGRTDSRSPTGKYKSH
jgi:hypothetical protein